MEQWMANVGALGVVTMYLGEKLIGILAKNGKPTNESRLEIVVQNNTEALHRLDTMLELIQERMRTHEENACKRHLDIVRIKDKCREECEKEHSFIKAEVIDLGRRGIS